MDKKDYGSAPAMGWNVPNHPSIPNPTVAQAGFMRNNWKNDSDVEVGNTAMPGFQFSDKEIRRGFIRKVYGILSIQLIVTIGFIATFLYVNQVRVFAKTHSYVFWIAFGITLVCMIAMTCFDSLRRKTPHNFIFLGIFTVCEGFLLGTVSTVYDAEAVIMAAGICAVVTLGLTLFAFQTKYDFTTCGGALCVMVLILSLAGMLMIFLPYNKYAMIGYGAAGALIFSMYIVYDTQIMMGGSHKYAISPEEYIFASLNLYLDIINLFLFILQIIGASKSN